MVGVVARWALTVALLYGVYTETGPWTTLALGFFFVFSELPALGDWLVTKYSDSMAKLKDD